MFYTKECLNRRSVPILLTCKVLYMFSCVSFSHIFPLKWYILNTIVCNEQECQVGSEITTFLPTHNTQEICM